MTRAALLLVVTVLTLMTDEAQGSWKLTAASSQPGFGQFFQQACLSPSVLAHKQHMCCAVDMWVACPETALQPQPGWVHLSTLSSFFCPYWTVKYHSLGGNLAEVDGWVAGLALCFCFRKDLSSSFSKMDVLWES